MQVKRAQNPEVAGLVKTIATHKDPLKRAEAAERLRQLQYTPVEAALQALSHREGEVRLWGIVRLNELGYAEATPHLIPLLKDSSHKVRLATIMTLGDLGQPAALQPLADFLVSKPYRISAEKNFETALIEALSKFDSPLATEAINRYRQRVRKIKRYNAVIITLAIGLMVISVVSLVLVRQSQASPFNNHLEAFLPDFPEEPGAEAYLRGKVVVVDKTAASLDQTFFDLPDDLRAANPAEVGTIVQIVWEKCEITSYKSSCQGYSSGYRHTGKLSIIDRSKGQIVGKATFTGYEPLPAPISRSTTRSGGRPYDDVKKYLLGLPRR
ncbi:MAG TPA: HEAT repeat domain-containing protein [Chloroflexia bacterium]|nr:HEAT repeat domain-containing protein [Chloroflexia bacterium]